MVPLQENIKKILLQPLKPKRNKRNPVDPQQAGFSLIIMHCLQHLHWVFFFADPEQGLEETIQTGASISRTKERLHKSY